MRSPLLSLKINLGLLFAALIMIFSGLLLQVNYHLGNQGVTAINRNVLGLSYSGWSAIHKISIVILLVIMIFHVYLHWKWYTTVMKKSLISKNKQTVALTALFVLVSVTGLAPWMINLLEGSIVVRKTFIEIHDKLAIILTVYLIMHIAKRWKWYSISLKKHSIL